MLHSNTFKGSYQHGKTGNRKKDRVKVSTRRPPKRRKVYNFECKKKEEEFVNKTVNSPVNNEKKITY